MLALEVAILLASTLNLFVSIAVAGSIIKLIRAMQQPARTDRRLIDPTNQPNYADIARFGSPNYDGFTPQPSNWDGVPRARQ